MLSPAETGIRGNSHMIMQDKNNLQIADLILKWIDERVGRAPGRPDDARPSPMPAAAVRTLVAAVVAVGRSRPPLASSRCRRPRAWCWSSRTTPRCRSRRTTTDENTRAQLARVNFLRDEPGGRRFFVNDLNGPLYILDKQTKQFTTYLDFNGARRAARAVPEVHVRAQLRDRPHQRHLRSRLRAQRRLLHDPHGGSVDAGVRRRRRPGVVPGLDLSGYTTTPAMSTPTVRRADRPRSRDDRVDGPQHRERDVRRHGARAAAGAVCRSPIHPLGEMTFNPAARPRRSGLARHVSRRRATRQSGEQRDSRRLNPQRLDTLGRQDPAHHPRPARAHARRAPSARTAATAFPTTIRSPRVEGARKEIWALRPAQSASAGLGRRSGAARSRRAARVQHRPHHAGRRS